MLNTHVGFLLREAILPKSGYIATITVMGRSEHFTERDRLEVVASDELSSDSLKLREDIRVQWKAVTVTPSEI